MEMMEVADEVQERSERVEEKIRMGRCNRNCLYNTLRIVNVVVNLFGILLIIYSLWLLKKWIAGLAFLPTLKGLPKPWFIYTCIGVGIAVFLSTLCGSMIANCITKSLLAAYIVSIFSLVLIQAGIIVIIFFRIDWEAVCECDL